MKADELLRQYEKVADAPNAIARLRRFILDLAVRGKLVPQDAGDAPAITLLHEIDAKRAEVDASRRAKIDRSQVDVSDVPFELPRTWVWTRLGRLTSYIQRGKSPSTLTLEVLRSFHRSACSGMGWTSLPPGWSRWSRSPTTTRCAFCETAICSGTRRVPAPLGE